MIVAWLVNLDPTYFAVEMFFCFCNGVGVVICFWMYYVDTRYHGGVFTLPEKHSHIRFNVTNEFEELSSPEAEIASPRFFLKH